MALQAYYQMLRESFVGWYAEERNKERVYYAALMAFTSLITILTCVSAVLGSNTGDRTYLVLWTLFFFFPLYGGGLFVLAMAARHASIAECRRLIAETGGPLPQVELI
jgi:hypothetical protein